MSHAAGRHGLGALVLACLCTAAPNAAPLGTPDQSAACPLQPFGTITVSPAFELDGPGRNIDSLDFWSNPDPAETLLFVTAKDNSLVEVWRHPFRDDDQPPLLFPMLRGSNVNGILVNPATNRLYLAVSEPISIVAVFRLPGFDLLRSFQSRWRHGYGEEPNLALLELPDGSRRLYVSADDVVHVHDALDGTHLSSFEPEKPLETLAADGFHQRLYIPDEEHHTGVCVYDAAGNPLPRRGLNCFGNEGIFDDDAEGILIYRCAGDGRRDDGRGFIVVADQIPEQTEFEFFDRESLRHLGTLRIEGVAKTDGIASLPNPLTGYPQGLFVAVDDDSTIVGVGWDVVFEAMRATTPTAHVPATASIDRTVQRRGTEGGL